ncbi:MAG: DivIVA domain-containing protein, partial [Microbacterium sp.]|nr:DivIVA domain-containing protein [Microbacterium sp.]
MALTPDDVVTKQFQHVRFKEGFDPDEVDDFLDEIVVEWRKTIAENDELKAKLAALESGTGAAPAAAEPAQEA